MGKKFAFLVRPVNCTCSQLQPYVNALSIQIILRHVSAITWRLLQAKDTQVALLTLIRLPYQLL